MYLTTKAIKKICKGGEGGSNAEDIFRTCSVQQYHVKYYEAENTTMIFLKKSLSTWKTNEFNDAFKHEVEQLGVEDLPLQQGLSQGSYASDEHLNVVVIRVSDKPEEIHVKAGIFYTGVLPGCACSDDAAPDNEYTEYCEVLFTINLKTAETTVSLLSD